MKAIFWQMSETLPAKFCKEIIEYAKTKDLSLGVTGIDTVTNDEIKKSLKKRQSSVLWLKENWIYRMLDPYINFANKEMHLNYQISTHEVCQFTVYERGQYYGWHQDAWPEPYPMSHRDKNVRNKNRKLSSTIALNSRDEYEGGVLQVALDNTHNPKRQVHNVDLSTRGSISVFPSYLWHRVTPVTKGTRYSLVVWTLGNSFK